MWKRKVQHSMVSKDIKSERCQGGFEANSWKEVYSLLSTGNITISYGRIASPNGIPNSTIMIGAHEIHPSLLPQYLLPLPVLMIFICRKSQGTVFMNSDHCISLCRLRRARSDILSYAESAVALFKPCQSAPLLEDCVHQAATEGLQNSLVRLNSMNQ